MKAIIRYTGMQLAVYSLDKGAPDDEVWSFLATKDAEVASYAKGFGALLQHIAEHGFSGLPNKKRSCWKQDGMPFCELIKGPWRISYFEFGRKILLTTVFRKFQDKPVEEYRRAIRLNETFKESPRWEG